MNFSPHNQKTPGVRYITEEFIRHKSQGSSLDRIKSLSINGVNDQKPVKFLENLNGLLNIQVLNLNNNIIEKIERIDKLQSLRELHLANNQIRRLDGIENLIHLKVLNVSRNEIVVIPHWLPKRLKYLTNINLSFNKIESVEEVCKLWSLKDLTELNVTGNIVTEFEHYRAYLVMRFRFLKKLDEVEIQQQERDEADRKYEERGIDRLTSRLLESEKQLEDIQNQQRQFTKEKDEFQQSKKKYQQSDKEKTNRIQQLEEEVKMKEQQLKKKSDDLFRACNKYYELEQDLAFIKIDAKFDMLSKDIGSLGEPDNASEQSASGMSGTEDQAYFGKGQFVTPREKELIRERMKTRNMKNGTNKNGERIYDAVDNMQVKSGQSPALIKENFSEALDEKIKEKLAELDQVNKTLENQSSKLLEASGDTSVQISHPLREILSTSMSNMPNSLANSQRPSPSSQIQDKLIFGTAKLMSRKSDRPKSALAASVQRQSSPLRSRIAMEPTRKLSMSEGNGPHFNGNGHQHELAEQFLNKFEILNDMQKEAHELRRKMDSTEKLANRQRDDVNFLRNELEKMRVADPKMALNIENEMRDKENQMDESIKLYKKLSKRLDGLSDAIESSMNDIKELEEQLLNDNHFFTADLRNKLQATLDDVKKTIREKEDESLSKKKDIDHLESVILSQQQQINQLQRMLADVKQVPDIRSARSTIEDDVNVLRNELKILKNDAVTAKEDLESEIEMEKVLNEEVSEALNKMQQENRELQRQVHQLSDQNRHMAARFQQEQSQFHVAMENRDRDVENEVLDRLDQVLQNPSIIKTPKSKMDQLLLEFMERSNQQSEDTKPEVLQPKIDEITSSIKDIKDNLSEFNRRLSTNSGQEPNGLHNEQVRPDSILKNSFQNSYQKTDEFTMDPIKQFLKKIDRDYKEEFDVIKDKIDGLERSIERSRRNRPKYQTATYKYSDLDMDENSSECPTAPSTNRSRRSAYKKSRSHSSDHRDKRHTSSKHMSHHAPNMTHSRSHSRQQHMRRGQSATPQYDASSRRHHAEFSGGSSDESAILDAMQDELESLRQHIQQSQNDNSYKIKHALDSINQLQTQTHPNLVRGHPNQNHVFSAEKDQVQENLRGIQNQLESCQNNMEALQSKIEQQTPQKTHFNSRMGSEFKDMEAIMEAQKKEIERLNGILEKMTNPTAAVSNESTQATHSHVQYVPPSFPAASYIHSQAQQTSVPASVVPNIPVMNTHVFAKPQQFTNTMSTPLLTNLTYYPPNTGNHAQPPIVNTGSESGLNSARFAGLFCNIPEHHYLEDCVNKGDDISKAKFHKKMKKETDKYMNELRMLQEDLRMKTDELDNVEIHISKQTGEIERLNYQIDQLNRTKQESIQEIDYLKQEAEEVNEVQLATATQSLASMNSKKAVLTNEIEKLEGVIENRQTELSRTENSLEKAHGNLNHVQVQTGEIIKRYEESKSVHRRLVLECEELEKRSKDASVELVKALNEITEVKTEVTHLSSNKVDLEEVVVRIQSLIDEKDRDFKRLTHQINDANKSLSEMEYDLTATSEERREKHKLLSEEQQIITDNRMELNRLKKEILQRQEDLGSLELELGQKNTLIQLNSEKLVSAEKMHQRTIQEYQSEQAILKRDIADLKMNIDSLGDNKNDLMSQMSQMKSKMNSMQASLEEKEKELMSRQTDYEKLQWQIKHSENIVNIKNGQLEKIQLDYDDKMKELEYLQKQIYEQQNEQKKLDFDIKAKISEIDRVRKVLVHEKDEMDRMRSNEEMIRSTVEHLNKEKEMLQFQMRETQDGVRSFKRQESELQEQLGKLESRLSETKADLERVQSTKQSDSVKVDQLKEEKSSLNKEIHESKCQLQSIRERTEVLQSQFHERTEDVRQKMQMQNKLNAEIRKIQDHIRVIGISSEEAKKHESDKQEKLFSLNAGISQKNDELRGLEKKIDNIREMIADEERKADNMKENNHSEMSRLRRELQENIENLEIANRKINQLKKNATLKEFTEHKILELEELIHHHEGVMEKYESDNKRLSNQIVALKRDLSNQRDNHDSEIEAKEKDLIRLQRRLANEMYQLEKVAGEQCARANGLAEDLGQARRDYLMLRNRILIYGKFINSEISCLRQEQLFDQQPPLFQDYLHPPPPSSKPVYTSPGHLHSNGLASNLASPNYTTLFPHSHTSHLDTHTVRPPNDYEEDYEVDEDEEEEDVRNNNRDLDENDGHPDIRDGVNGYYRKENGISSHNNFNLTSSSGLGSTVESQENNENMKKILHMRYGAEIERMQSEQNQCETLCQKLKSEVQSLKKSIPNGASNSSLHFNGHQ